MKLVTYTHDAQTSVGALVDETHLVDLHHADPEIPGEMIALLGGGDAMMERARRAIGNANARIPLAAVTLHAPVLRPGKVLAIGLNYRDHAAETGQQLPKYPIVFSKATTCIIAPGSPIHRPKVSTAVDWEGELCFVIGKVAKHVSASAASEYIAGYMCGNDVTVRDWQGHTGQWVMGKGFDTHGPIGPWLVTRDEVDAENLGIRTLVDGEVMQESNTGQLIFSISAIVEYITTAMTLEPGDIVFTGTPSGVGVSRKPPRFLKHGDTVRVEIDGLGALENPVIDEP